MDDERDGDAKQPTARLTLGFAALALISAPATANAQVEGPVAQQLALPNSAPAGLFNDAREPTVLAVQILLDRARHSPGVIDGIMGANTRRAIERYEQANGLALTGRVTPALVQRLARAHGGSLLQSYTITEEDANGPFRDVPGSMAGQAKLDTVAFESPAEKLAEKFHMAQSFLKALNPGADFSQPGTSITVVKPGGERLQAEVTRIEVHKAAKEVRAFGAGGSLLATYPTTVGSSFHPSPNTTLEVLAVAMDPTYHFDLEGRNWGPEKELTIAPGPNNPVGTVWIDLSREGYGIHGTPEPRLIGKTSSHGCVRLTNWDAVELGKAVKKGTTVEFI